MATEVYGKLSHKEAEISKAYLGLADNTVSPGKREERKSVGVERTFRDKTDDQDILDTLTEIAAELEKDLERLQYAGKTITIKFKVSFMETALMPVTYIRK